MTIDEEIAAFLRIATATLTGLLRENRIKDIGEVEIAWTDLGREPVFMMGGDRDESMLAMRIHSLRSMVAKAEGRRPPPPPEHTLPARDAARDRIKREKAAAASARKTTPEPAPVDPRQMTLF